MKSQSLNSEAFIGRFLHNALEKFGNEVKEEPIDKIHTNLWEKTQKYKTLLAKELQFDDDHLRAWSLLNRSDNAINMSMRDI